MLNDKSRAGQRLVKTKVFQNFRMILCRMAAIKLPFMESDAIVYEGIRAELERKGQSIYNLQRAAQALSREITVVTNNEKEFRRVLG